LILLGVVATPKSPASAPPVASSAASGVEPSRRQLGIRQSRINARVVGQDEVMDPSVPTVTLTDLLGRLEADTDVTNATGEEIDAARAEVGRDMGW
jgi:hypothetical protein